MGLYSKVFLHYFCINPSCKRGHNSYRIVHTAVLGRRSFRYAICVFFTLHADNGVDMKLHQLYSSLEKMGYFSLYLELRDKPGMVSNVLGHEKTIQTSLEVIFLILFEIS